MKIKVVRVWDADIMKYKDVLDTFSAEYVWNKDYQKYDTVFIYVNGLNGLFDLVKMLDQDVLITNYQKKVIQIYDDYIE